MPLLALLDPEHPNHAITLQNQKQSPLLKLPGELRNKIYKYVCSRYVIHKDCYGNFFVAGSPRLTGAHLVAMSAVCRQLYDETALLPFRLNRFSFSGCVDIGGLLSPEQLAAIRKMSVSCDTYCGFNNDAYSDEFLAALRCCSGLESLIVGYHYGYCPRCTVEEDPSCRWCERGRKASLVKEMQIREEVGTQVQVYPLTCWEQSETESVDEG